MRHIREIPDFLMPIIEVLEAIESNTIIEEETDITEDALQDALDGLSRIHLFSQPRDPIRLGY